MAEVVYEIMRKDRRTAVIDSAGGCRIYFRSFLPYNLYLDDSSGDIGTRVNNVTNFNYWCASRVLTLDRKYAKEILNSVGMAQAVTDKDRAVERELLASKICRCFRVSQVLCEKAFFEGERVSASENMTSKEFSIASGSFRNITVCLPEDWNC